MKSLAQKIAMGILGTLIVLAAAGLAQQTQPTTYARMAPIEQYFMSRDAEIALAESAAPASISRDATILVMERHGYETAKKGKNGFTCLVQRSWTAPSDHPEFWNPKLRAPVCYNAEASRSYLPRVLKKTEMALAGNSREQISTTVATALEKRELPGPEPGSMCYMLSRQGHLDDRVGHWQPHLMFFVPQTDTAEWGANAAGSPILGVTDNQEHFTVYLIPVGHWSDGTAAPAMAAPDSGQQ